MTILVTGATGFIGRILCNRLLMGGFNVRGTLLGSEDLSALPAGVEPVVVEPLGEDTKWAHALEGVDTIVHLAARVHIMNDPTTDPLSEFRKTNVAGTKRLALESVKAGVKRFVFISSIKVNGEESASVYSSDSLPNPSDPYGISKWEAEQWLRTIEAEAGLEVVIVRPTLVYGPGVKANFFNFLRFINRGIPLPLDSVANKRSLVFVRNLVDALVLCVSHPKAAGKTYLLSDGDDVSTPELIRRIAESLGVAPRLFGVPVSFMRLAGKLTGQRASINRLTGSLAVDLGIRNELGWTPPFTMQEGLAETAAWFKSLK